MSVPLLTLAANGHYWLCFESSAVLSWQNAQNFLQAAQFREQGTVIAGIDEAIFPSWVKGAIEIATGFDAFCGHYLLAYCVKGDQVLLSLAQHLSALSE